MGNPSNAEVPLKLLTVVVTGRNDDYMGNFKYRLNTCLNFLACHFQHYGRLDDVEFLVTDWNSEAPLSKALSLTPEAAQVTRFVRVPPALADSLVAPGEVFYPTCAMNTSIRRGRGQFIMMYDADSLMPQYSVRALLELLDGQLDVPFALDQALLFCIRHQIPWEIVQREIDLNEWDRYFLLNGGLVPRDASRMSGLGIYGAAQMMHRSLWQACRGYNQALHIQGWLDAELTLRVTQRYPWLDMAGVGVSVFHMEHWPRSRRMPGVQRHNPPVVSRAFAANDVNWGLGDRDLEIEQATSVGESSTSSTPSGIGTDGQTARWERTRQQVLAELTSPQVRRHVRRTVYRSSVHPADWGSLYALAWYSLYHYPRRYLEFGFHRGYTAQVVAAACPGVEIYGIDPWQPTDGYPVQPPYYAAGLLEKVGYTGYTRLITGEPSTAFQRLRSSFIGPLSLDLVLFRGDMWGEASLEPLRDVVPHLAPGGALVFSCPSSRTFEAVWKEVQRQFPRLTYWQCRRRNTGLILAVAVQDEPTQAELASEEATLAIAWRSLRFNRLVALIDRWGKRLGIVWKMLRPEPVWRWPAILRLAHREFLWRRRGRALAAHGLQDHQFESIPTWHVGEGKE